jgi:hypothetical protein
MLEDPQAEGVGVHLPADPHAGGPAGTWCPRAANAVRRNENPRGVPPAGLS